MRKLIGLAVLFAGLLTAAMFLLHKPAQEPHRGEELVALNEICRLMETGDNASASEKAAELEERMRAETQTETDHRAEAMYVLSLLFLAAVTAYGCIAVIHPFEKLGHFAEEIANGNFELPLKYERSNYFGKFTWGFDRMRREISNARALERAAIENNKTVIASLSHDIKTPVASVRAYAEALDLGMDQTPEQRSAFLETMMRKCDEITQLTDNMLLHALSDLGSLRMKPETFDLGELTAQTVRDLSAGSQDIRFEKPLFPAYVHADPLRTAQILENLIHNARKYAKTAVDLSISRDENEIVLHMQDSGGGIPESDMPFICDRFYRGKNCGTEHGAGLGLYIVKYITEQSDGTLHMENKNGGLCTEIRLPTANESVMRN